MSPNDVMRPRLPRHLYEPHAGWALAFVAYALLLFVGGGALAATVASSALPLWVRLLAVPALVLLAAQGAHLLGFVGHEGIHLMLHRNKYVSALAGAFFSAMTSFSAAGYGVAHWNHHRYTNQESDPDARIYPQFRTFWSRFLKARPAGSRAHMRNTIDLALGRPLALGYKLPFSASESQLLARVNLGFLVFWLVTYATIAYFAPVYALVGIVLPILAVIPMSGLRGYVEHAGTGLGVFRDTRSFASPIFTVLFFGNNFHLEHHLYPGVPCYNLATVHRLLRYEGCFERWGSPVETTVRGTLMHTTARSQYPEPTNPDQVDDPFVRGGVPTSASRARRAPAADVPLAVS